MEKVYLVLLIFIPAIVLFLGWGLYKFPPKEIEQYYGYRTKRARSSKEAWIFAQQYSGRLYIIIGILMLILAVITYMLLKRQLTEGIFMLLLILETVAIFIPVPIVERALKSKFGSIN